MRYMRVVLRFFFFFKQKTAYEMRISDWSSDVCSSDLAGVSLLWGLVGYSLAYAPGSGWLGGRAHLLLADLGALRDGLTVPESAFVLFQMALAMLAAGLLPGAVAERVRLGRSEEHTSELQSLMRISYAVFCLKKKTQKTQTKRARKNE